MADYGEVNRANWDERVPAHVASADYAVQRFVSDQAFISDVVRFDVPLLGDIAGLRGVHLQLLGIGVRLIRVVHHALIVDPAVHRRPRERERAEQRH